MSPPPAPPKVRPDPPPHARPDPVRHISTRGEAPAIGFCDALLAGLARDGGLYVPERWPTLAASNAHTYAERAVEVMLPFVEPDIDEITLTRLCTEAYDTFRHPAVVPLVQLDHRQWVQELFHGPTLAFKDVALQLVGRMFDHVLGERGQRVTIVGATSGDTGSAVPVEACTMLKVSSTVIFWLPVRWISSSVRPRQGRISAALPTCRWLRLSLVLICTLSAALFMAP